MYDKHCGALIGFSDLGNVNNLLLEFERSLSSDVSNKESVSKAMLVFMVRGLFTCIQFPYAQFACSSVNGEQIRISSFLGSSDAIGMVWLQGACSNS